MLRNKGVFLGFAMVAFAPVVTAQVMTVTEAVLKQSEIARVEMEGRLEEARKKISGFKASEIAAPTTPVATTFTEKPAEEILSLVSVYGVGDKLKADFVFRGTIVTLEPGGTTKAAGWGVEKLTATEAVLVKYSGKKVLRRNTVYLSAASTSDLPASPTAMGPVPSVAVATALPLPVPVAPMHPTEAVQQGGATPSPIPLPSPTPVVSSAAAIPSSQPNTSSVSQ